MSHHNGQSDVFLDARVTFRSHENSPDTVSTTVRVRVFCQFICIGHLSLPKYFAPKEGYSNGKPMAENTIRLHRVLHATPERVYRAFLDSDAMAKWLPPNGFTGKVHHIDAKVGGTYKMSFTNFSTGKSHSFGGKYLHLTPNEHIVRTDVFDDPNLPGEMKTEITLRKTSVGTELNIVQAGIPAVIPLEACYLGWQESLTLLAKLVEAEIPD